MARYSISDSSEFNPNPFPSLKGTDLHSRAQDTTARWTHVFGPSLLNVAQAAYYDRRFGVLGTDYIATPYTPFWLVRDANGDCCWGSGAWEVAGEPRGQGGGSRSRE